MLKPTPNDTFVLRGDNAEMRTERLAAHDYFTPTAEFFVRNNNGTPRIDASAWRLRVGGDGARHPIELTYEELRALPAVTLARVLECTGNGRTFFGSVMGRPTPGTDWKLGAFGVAKWTGVPLATLLAMAGTSPETVCVMPVGADGIERPMPIAKALEPDTLMAYAMNDEPLLPDHGFPARALVPGWGGIASIKWVTELVVSLNPIHTDKNTHAYVYAGDGYEPEPPALGPATTHGTLKAVIALPYPATLARGRCAIAGFAFSPFDRIAAVEVSLDGGVTWQRAALTGPNIERAGTRWTFDFDAKPDLDGIAARAIDASGNVQWAPHEQRFNALGYNYGAWVVHPVRVV